MSNGIQPFAFEDHLVRTILDDGGEPWFVAKDVALALGYQWNGAACIAHVPEEWRGVRTVLTLRRGEQEMLTLSEQGLNFFVLRSDKPAALPFQKWLAGEVLPALRRTGRYELALESLEDALSGLSPRVRLHCLRLAVQVSLAANAPQGVEATFARFCSLVKERPEERAAAHDLPGLLRQFVQQCCRPQAGSTLSGRDLYEAFLRWCKAAGIAPGCTIKAVSSTVQALDLLRVRQTRPYISFDGVCLCRGV